MAELEPVFLDDLDVTGQELRTAYSALQAGVMGAGDLKVTAAAGNTVDVAPGVAFVPLSVLDGGLVRARESAVRNSATFEGGGIPAADAINPRIDQIVARVFDVAGSRRWRIMVVTGLPTGGATLDNRSGAAALPADTLRLTDRHLTPAGVATLRDRRTWARGAFRRIIRTTNGIGANDYSNASSAAINGLDDTNLSPRMELSGVPTRVSLFGSHQQAVIQLFLNDTQVDVPGGSTDGIAYSETTTWQHLGASWPFTPAAGNYRVRWGWRRGSGAGTALIAARPTIPLLMVVEETLRQNASND